MVLFGWGSKLQSEHLPSCLGECHISPFMSLRVSNSCVQHGVKLVGQFCMPPKKRHPFWPQSPESISPSPTTYSPNAWQQTDKECYAQEPGLSCPGAEADTSVSESVPFTVPNKSASVKSSPCHDKRIAVPAFCVTCLETDTKGKLHREDTLEAVSEKNDLPSAPMSSYDLSTTHESGAEFPSHEFKVQQVEDEEKKPLKQVLKSLATKNCSGSVVTVNKQETLNSCSDDAMVGEDILKDNSLSEKTGFSELCSDRSNWYLNTIMESWEGSFPTYELGEHIHNGGFGSHDNHASIFSDDFHSASKIELKLNSAMTQSVKSQSFI